jgi:uroporphyrinogen-III synthase
VVGARTAQAAIEAGLSEPEIIAADAKELAQAIAQSLQPPANLLYPAARERKPDLEKALGAKGFSINPWIVYEAQAAPALPDEIAQALRAGSLDAALHYSMRSAEIFCASVAQADLAEAARRLRHVAISQDCAQGLSALNAPDVRIAAAPNEDSMAELLG